MIFNGKSFYDRKKIKILQERSCDLREKSHDFTQKSPKLRENKLLSEFMKKKMSLMKKGLKRSCFQGGSYPNLLEKKKKKTGSCTKFQGQKFGLSKKKNVFCSSKKSETFNDLKNFSFNEEKSHNFT